MPEILDLIEDKIYSYRPHEFLFLDDEWRRLVGYNNYYRWLWSAVTVLEPKLVVEIGRERGVSAGIMLTALPRESRLISIDINPEAKFLVNINDDRLIQLTCDSREADVPNGIDFLFIDGDHTKETVAQEWALYKPRMSPKSLVAFDDIHFNEGMSEFWESLDEDKYELPQYHEPGFGVALIGW